MCTPVKEEGREVEGVYSIVIEGQRVLIWMAARGITPQVCKWRESPPTISPRLEPAERQCSQASQVVRFCEGGIRRR